MTEVMIKRLRPSFNIPADEVEAYIQFMFLISNKPDYIDFLERNRFKQNKSLAFRNFFQSYICKHDDKIQANKNLYEKFREEFLAELNKNDDGKQKQQKEKPKRA